MKVGYFFTAEDLKTGLDEDSAQIADIISDYVLNYRLYSRLPEDFTNPMWKAGAFRRLYPNGYEGRDEAASYLERAKIYCRYVARLLTEELQKIETPELGYYCFLFKEQLPDGRVNICGSHALDAPIPEILTIARG